MSDERNTHDQALDECSQPLLALKMNLRAARFFALHIDEPTHEYDRALSQLAKLDGTVANLVEQAKARAEAEGHDVGGDPNCACTPKFYASSTQCTADDDEVPF